MGRPKPRRKNKRNTGNPTKTRPNESRTNAFKRFVRQCYKRGITNQEEIKELYQKKSA
jgi:ribosomal protein S21